MDLSFTLSNICVSKVDRELMILLRRASVYFLWVCQFFEAKVIFHNKL